MLKCLWLSFQPYATITISLSSKHYLFLSFGEVGTAKTTGDGTPLAFILDMFFHFSSLEAHVAVCIGTFLYMCLENRKSDKLVCWNKKIYFSCKYGSTKVDSTQISKSVGETFRNYASKWTHCGRTHV